MPGYTACIGIMTPSRWPLLTEPEAESGRTLKRFSSKNGGGGPRGSAASRPCSHENHQESTSYSTCRGSPAYCEAVPAVVVLCTVSTHLGQGAGQAPVLEQVGAERVRPVDGGGSFVALHLDRQLTWSLWSTATTTIPMSLGGCVPVPQEDYRGTTGEPQENHRRTTGEPKEDYRRTKGGLQENHRRTIGRLQENQRRTTGEPKEDHRRTIGGLQENQRRTTGGLQENHRRTIGGLQENQRRTTGGLQENHRRITGEPPEDYRRTTGGLQENHRRTTGEPQEDYRRTTGGLQENHRRSTLSEVQVSSSICCSCSKAVTQSWFTRPDLRHINQSITNQSITNQPTNQ
ncbi:S-antigen protein [Liparis tanakae]|uniref:S-antigen protein n=1 Tax=Liparis tanakae TaxID=230148 RepID=A0A4Z2EJ06_9TELE|nr:S-antigen protein [Liparis tanakae]